MSSNAALHAGLTWHSPVPKDAPKFVWLVSCASVFLIVVDYATKSGVIVTSPDGGLVPLIAHYMALSGTNLAAAACNVRARKVNLASHSHVELVDA